MLVLISVAYSAKGILLALTALVTQPLRFLNTNNTPLLPWNLRIDAGEVDR